MPIVRCTENCGGSSQTLCDIEGCGDGETCQYTYGWSWWCYTDGSYGRSRDWKYCECTQGSETAPAAPSNGYQVDWLSFGLGIVFCVAIALLIRLCASCVKRCKRKPKYQKVQKYSDSEFEASDAELIKH
eukprot:753495_1